MRKILVTASGLACALALAALLSACKADDMGNLTSAAQTNTSQPAQANTSQPAQASSPDAARRVTVAELQEKLEKGEAVIYDTRSKESYDQEHIKGALSMPSNEVASRTGELPKDKLIVFYCT